MDSPVKSSRKKKSLQITYPAPYSQSWNPDVTPVLLKDSALAVPRPPNRLCRTMRAESPRARSHQFQDRPDPTVPHLKYGVFRNRRGSVPRPLPNTERPQKKDRFPKSPGSKNLSPMKEKPKRASKSVIRVPAERPIRAYSATTTAYPEPKTLVPKDNSRHQPVLVTRTITESYSRKLCQSKIMHLEIKPTQTTSLWPTFNQNVTRKSNNFPVSKKDYRGPIYAIP